MVIDVPAQFAKLCPCEMRDLMPEQMLDIINRDLSRCRLASARGHWTYDFNRHIALAELGDAIAAELAKRRAAA